MPARVCMWKSGPGDWIRWAIQTMTVRTGKTKIMTGNEMAISMARLKKRLSGFSSGSSRKPMKRKPSSSKCVTG
jgi:hypothetical protein